MEVNTGRIGWGFVKTLLVTYFFVLGTEPDWPQWQLWAFSVGLGVVGVMVGVAQTLWDHYTHPDRRGDPTQDDDDIDQPL
jgi:hypothetical protein